MITITNFQPIFMIAVLIFGVIFMITVLILYPSAPKPHAKALRREEKINITPGTMARASARGN